MQRALPCVLVVLLTAACGSDLSSTAPSPSQIVVEPAAPDKKTYTLAGRVTESMPTASDGIAGATLTVSDGINAGKFTVADARGFYTLSGLHPEEFAMRVTAPGFVAASERVTIAYDRTSNVRLHPEPQRLVFSLHGDIASVDGQCSDGQAMRSCRIILFPVHNPGPIQATLHWTTEEDVDLDLTLFQTDGATPIARSAHNDDNVEQLRGDVVGGATYELRVTLSAGTGAASYTLDFSQPN
jgi:hypothetical protein